MAGLSFWKTATLLCGLHCESDTINIFASLNRNPWMRPFRGKNIMKHICQFCTNRGAGIIILTRKAICFQKEADTTVLWSIDYTVWQAGCIAWWIVSHYTSSLGLSELLVPLHRAELHTAEHQTTADRHWNPNVGRNNAALFNYSNAVLNICVCPFD